jgi:hypothetical protein
MNTIIALEESNFLWVPNEYNKVIQAYEQRYYIAEISKFVRRPQVEVACLIMDLGKKGVLSKWKN